MHTSFAAAKAAAKAAEAQLNSSRGQPLTTEEPRWLGLCSMSLGMAARVMRRVPGYAFLQPDPRQVWVSTAGGVSALLCIAACMASWPTRLLYLSTCCTGRISQEAAI